MATRVVQTVDWVVDDNGTVVGQQRKPGDITGGFVNNLSADKTITSLDDGKVFACTTALTLTIPASLSPRPSFIVNPPPAGNVSIAVSGGANINGGTTTLTRSRSSNPAGVAVVAYADSDGYGVSGS